MDIAVIIMGMIAVIAGVAGFIMEHGGNKDSNETAKDPEK